MAKTKKPVEFQKPDMVELIEYINLRHGNAGPIIRPANEAWSADDLRRPCGIPSLDVAAGGGLVAGKVHQVDAPEGTGKNYLLYRYFARLQENYGDSTRLAMACFESFVDKQFAQMCGCQIAMSPYDIDVANRSREAKGLPKLTEIEEIEALNCPQVGTFHVFEGPSEGVLGGIVDAVEANLFQMIGIDSWDAMMTFQEDNAELNETPQVASPAMLQTKWSKKILDAFNPIFRCPLCGAAPLEKKVTNYKLRNYKYVCTNHKCGWRGRGNEAEVEIKETTLYCIRQVRDKLSMGGKVYGRAYKADGARSLRHLNHIRLSLHPGSYIRDPPKSGKKIAKEVNWEITKAKSGAKEGRAGMFQLFFDPLEVDVLGDLFAQCLMYKVIVDEGKGWYAVPDIEMDRVHGKDSILTLMENEDDLTSALLEQLYINAGLAHVRFC